MADSVIQVQSLSKRYELGGQTRLDQTLPELIARQCGRLLNRRGGTPVSSREFWALRDIEFNIHRGEVVGIIGANGAGKSTLLKILCEITDPTEGQAIIRGRVGSLLEVGTGFHPELSGRENIYLNGAVLGMTRREIAAKFQQIVEFSGVEQFLDTPVKRYSSGMTVRLAFAVAAHLEPEILIVDEVLAVGDAEFQDKCLGKMRAVAGGEGRTVLFVSHNMTAVAALCDRAIMLQQGRVVCDGPAQDVVEQYLGRLSRATGSNYRCDKAANDHAWIAAAQLLTTAAQPAGCFLMSDGIDVQIDLDVRQRGCLTLGVQVQELDHNPVFHFHSTDSRFTVPSSPGRHRVIARLPAMNLCPGEYLINLTLCDAAGNRYTQLHIPEPLRFEVRQDGALCARPLHRSAALIYNECQWRSVSAEASRIMEAAA